MEKLKKYQTQIITFVTIALLMTYGIFPALTAANTLLNIVGGIGGLILLLWLGLSLKEYITLTDGESGNTDELKEFSGTELDYVTKPKAKRKPKSKVTLDFTDAKGMNEIDNVITPIVEGRVKISVENPKPNRKPKTRK